MARGKQKGFKKDIIEIRDESIKPFYIVREDKQFVLMREDNTLPQGYYNKLSFLLQDVSKSIILERHAGTVLSIKQYINSYQDVNSQIINSIDV